MGKTFAAFAMAALLGVAACSSSGGGATAPPSAAVSKSPTTAPPDTSSSSTNSHAAGGLTQETAQDALLIATDIGAGFAQTTSDAATSPLPCTPNDPPLDKLVPPKVKAQSDFQNTAGSALLSEEIDGYADDATALRVLAAGEKGLACQRATIKTGGQNLAVRLTGPTDLTSSLKVAVDKCEGWQVKASSVEVVLIVARIGPQIVALTFTAATSVDKSTLPSTAAVTEKALSKVKDAA
jgi:hypothetical protein